jgi:hypothetical protein
MGIKIFQDRIKSLEEAAAKILNEAGFGYASSSSSDQPSPYSSNQQRFKTASSDDEYFETKAERDREEEEDNIRRSALRKKMNQVVTDKTEGGDEYSKVDEKGQPVRVGLDQDEQNEMKELAARKRERDRQQRFQAQQRSRERTRLATQKGIEQSRRLAGR